MTADTAARRHVIALSTKAAMRTPAGLATLAPFCHCGLWTLAEVQWRSQTKVGRVCVWCASRRPALAVRKVLEATP